MQASGEVAQTRPAEEAVRPDRGQPDLEDPEDLRAAVVVEAEEVAVRLQLQRQCQLHHLPKPR